MDIKRFHSLANVDRQNEFYKGKDVTQVIRNVTMFKDESLNKNIEVIESIMNNFAPALDDPKLREAIDNIDATSQVGGFSKIGEITKQLILEVQQGNLNSVQKLITHLNEAKDSLAEMIPAVEAEAKVTENYNFFKEEKTDEEFVKDIQSRYTPVKTNLNDTYIGSKSNPLPQFEAKKKEVAKPPPIDISSANKVAEDEIKPAEKKDEEKSESAPASEQKEDDEKK